jgi:hypothetical protein
MRRGASIGGVGTRQFNLNLRANLEKVSENQNPHDHEAPEELKEVDCETSNNNYTGKSENEDVVAPGAQDVHHERDQSNERAAAGVGNKVPPIMVN